jgi:DNA-binding MarR family transcriptional regulator
LLLKLELATATTAAMNIVAPEYNSVKPTAQAPSTVPYEVWQREHDLRLKAERDLQYYKNEFFLHRKIRHAPVLQPIARDVLDECRHVEKWGKVKAPDGSTRANFKTIANKLHSSPATVKRHAERLEKLGLIEIHEQQGPEDESERKYIHVKEERVALIDELADPDKIVPQRGGNRYICLNAQCQSTDVSVRKVTKTTLMIHCHTCLEDTVTEEEEDTGWKRQNGHKRQNQLGFQQSKHAEHTQEPQKQFGYHSVDTCLGIPPRWLRLKKVWCPWRYEEPETPGGKPKKVPYQTRGRAPQEAKSNDPLTWSTYDDAQSIYEASQGWKYPFDGIGMMCDGSFVGIDLDHCRDKDTGEWSDQALDIVARFASYTYITPSGEGLRIIIHAKKPGTHCRRGDIEIYEEKRFFTWTPEQLAGTPDELANDCQAELDALYKEVWPEAPEPPKSEPKVQIFTPSRTNDEVLHRARTAKNGAKFIALYDLGDITGYPSQSEADQALCRMLAHWAGGNVSTIKELFRHSKLYRPKWDRADYQERTISRALQQGQVQA